MWNSDRSDALQGGLRHAAGLAAMVGYLGAEYVWPVVRRKLIGPGSDLCKRLKIDQKQLRLNSYEEELAEGAVHADSLNISFEDIGGNAEAIRKLQQVISMMFEKNHTSLFESKSRFIHAPTGILLYGPPGCGKTMMAKALARHSNVRFLPVKMSTLIDKYVGESEKYIDALFSLARKLAPVIVFFDEIDGVTRRRASAVDHSAGGEWASGVKAQLLASWDGVASDNSGVVILGATNRSSDIDEAFMRRMPLQIKVDLPDQSSRRVILEKLLSDESCVDLVDLSKVSNATVDFSGSDLYELVRRTVVESHYNQTVVDTKALLNQIDIFMTERDDCSYYNY